jgi:hypothetical protein
MAKATTTSTQNKQLEKEREPTWQRRHVVLLIGSPRLKNKNEHKNKNLK